MAALPTHEDAPRVLISTAMVVPEWSDQDTFRRLEDAGPDDVRADDRRGLVLIGTQGILGFTYETFRAIAAKHFGGSLSGRRVLTAGLGGMGGAQGFGVGLNGGRALIVEVDPGPRGAPPGGRLGRPRRRRYDDGLAAPHPTGPGAVALVGNAAEVVPRLLPRASSSTSSPTRRRPTTPPRLRAQRLLGGGGARGRRGDPASSARSSTRSTARTSPRCSASSERGAVVFEYGNGIRAQARGAGPAGATEIPGFVAEYVRPLLARGVGPFRWIALSGDPEDLRRSSRTSSWTSVGTDTLRGWIELARDASRCQGLPARICWLGLGRTGRWPSP